MAFVVKTGEALHVEDFVVQGGGAVGHDVELELAVAELDAVGAFVEEVDRRHAVQAEVAGVDQPVEVDPGPREEEVQLQILAGQRGQVRAQAGEVEEQEAAGECEVLLQQPHARERARLRRQHGVGVVKAHRLQTFARQQLAAVSALRRTDEHADQARAEQLVQAQRNVGLATQVQAKVIELQLRQAHARVDAQPHAHRAARPLGHGKGA